jgi:Tfp pilus assembly protein PilF
MFQWLKKRAMTTPMNVDKWMQLASKAYGEGDFARAAECLQEILQLDDQHLDAMHNLGLVYQGAR